MRSVPLVAPRRLDLTETKMPDGPRAGEILVRLRAVGLCGSDLHWWADGRIHATTAKYPQVLGHEPAGEVVEVGPGVTDFRPGDRVSIEPSLTCGHCEYCLSGRHNLCIHSRFMGGPDAEGFLRDFAVVPAHNADPVPEGLSWREATLMEPVAVWVHVFELSPVRIQQTIGILGCGPIGLLGVALAKNAGCRVIACDRAAHRVALARAMGADIAVDVREFREAVHQDTRGRGAHQTFDAAGAPETIQLGFQCTRDGGRFTLIGIPTPLHFEVDLHTAMAKELSLQMMKRSNHKGRAAGTLLEAGAIPFDLMTHALPLEQAQEGFELAHECREGVGKVVFEL
jgi:L-iditol 2-dehydrogenase